MGKPTIDYNKEKELIKIRHEKEKEIEDLRHRNKLTEIEIETKARLSVEKFIDDQSRQMQRIRSAEIRKMQERERKLILLQEQQKQQNGHK